MVKLYILNTHTQKIRDSKKQSDSNTFSQRHSNSNSSIKLIDNSPKGITQLKIQELANNVHQPAYLKNVQNTAVAHSVNQNNGLIGQNFGLKDNRPETVIQNKLLKAANNFLQSSISETIQLKPKKSKYNRKNKRLAKHLGLHASSFSESATTSHILTEPEARDEEDALDREIMYYENAAHGIDVNNTKDITLAQEKYQKLLSQKMGTSQIMDSHRSVGFEYEFATYEVLKPSLKIDSHNELGHSKRISSLFNIPFKLETDSENELEIVTPPLLIANDNSAINKSTAKRLYQYYKDSASDLREKNKGKVVSTLNLASEGFGNGWKFDPSAKNLKVSVDRKKHQDSDNEIYSQMNISLTLEETSNFMDKQSMSWVADENAETLEGSEIFSKAYFRILNLLNENDNKVEEGINFYLQKIDPKDSLPSEEAEQIFEEIEDKVENLNFLISRSLANSLAIPSIIFNEHFRDKELLNSLHSSVKETFGIWVKDTIQNIISGFVAEDSGTKMAMENLLKSCKAEILEIIEQELHTDLNGAFPTVNTMFDSDHQKIEERLVALKGSIPDIVRKEVNTTIDSLLSLLNDEKVKMFDYQSQFLNESFNDNHSGFGVRKDTYTPITSGNKTNLNLVEIRNDESIDKFLK